ncbi:ATP-binding protein [Teredinibacter waterburyi]|jgi:Signal transduction histidine kinase|uniref:ATP-binding protein n=1 Tax=Teredinibacter waterburyi TaxID=1500538 RepID=UPI00165F3938|nr:ATP-binding protein [Teredinibacter waterburyi]
MNRAFISLYLLIVFSIIGLGWGIDKVWQHYNYEPEDNPFINSIFALLESDLKTLDDVAVAAKLNSLSKESQVVLRIYELTDFASSDLGERLVEGSVVTLTEMDQQLVSYKRLANTDNVISIEHKLAATTGVVYYQVLLVFFYAAIALVVYFWLWPLSRDLRLLETQTRKLGRDGVPAAVEIGPRSAIYDLAQSFNRMSDRIRELISTHKEMTYAVSHELRTPLARMKFALEMAADIPDRELQTKKLAGIREDISEMENLINELLTYAGFEQGVSKLNLKPGHLSSLVRDVLKANRGLMVDIRHSMVDKLGETQVFCEWYLMERAIHNIVQNAQRYAHSRVRITLDADDKDYIVRIEDDGPGIAEEDRKRVFSSFVRLRQNTNFDKSGFGLGLSIVHRIMEWHNGSAEVMESCWQGACFELRWPQPYKLD